MHQKALDYYGKRLRLKTLIGWAIYVQRIFAKRQEVPRGHK